MSRMDFCQIIYALVSLAYIVFFNFGGAKLSEEIFTYPRLIFLIGLLLHLTLYNLVPSSLKCPPFYPFYKAIAAIVLSNAILFTFWYNVELLVTWVMTVVKPHVDFLPQSVKEKVPPVEPIILLLISFYYTFWVTKSVIEQKWTYNVVPETPVSMTRRSRPRSNRRCY